jgi:quinoprotein glucose dehydrogenase
MRFCFFIILLAPLTRPVARAQQPAPRPSPSSANFRDWKVYGGTLRNIRYSTLDQINRGNVSKLEPVWTFDTHDSFAAADMECNPIVVDGVLYATTPRLRVIALDAATGRQLWAFDPDPSDRSNNKQHSRGVAFWGPSNAVPGQRIFVTARHNLYALDAKTGRPIPSFGKEGRVDLREGLGRDPNLQTISATTPGVVYKDLLILGSTVPESLPSAPGDIRAYDVRTGKIRWTFHTIPHPGEFGYDTWPNDAWKYSGGTNNWAGMSLDEKRGLVFVPTGSASFDFYGANRIGDNLFANCLIALRADTGERVWHFQVVRHDLWDRDLPAPPSLVTVERDGKPVDAVAQITKSGYVFVFDRENGKPLFPIEYRPVPQSDVEGEVAAAMQPFPRLPPPFSRQKFTEEMITTRTPEAHAAVLEKFRQYRTAGQFLPPSLQGSIILPGLDGGGEWGGAAFDPETRLLYVNANERAQVLKLVEKPQVTGPTSGCALYLAHCSGCHGTDLKGNEYPPLIGIGAKLSPAQIALLIRRGSGRMPGLPGLEQSGVQAIIDYVATGKNTRVTIAAASPTSDYVKYKLAYNRLYDPDGYPAVEPPWGTLNAINLNTGAIVWKIPFGEFPELVAKGLHDTGSENYGGPVVTAGGLLFIGATSFDRKFHAYDKATGKLLWETTLPAAGNATPAIYEIAGRQYVAIAAGGGKNGGAPGGSYVAFALPASLLSGRSH